MGRRVWITDVGMRTHGGVASVGDAQPPVRRHVVVEVGEQNYSAQFRQIHPRRHEFARHRVVVVGIGGAVDNSGGGDAGGGGAVDYSGGGDAGGGGAVDYSGGGDAGGGAADYGGGDAGGGAVE